MTRALVRPRLSIEVHQYTYADSEAGDERRLNSHFGSNEAYSLPSRPYGAACRTTSCTGSRKLLSKKETCLRGESQTKRKYIERGIKRSCTETEELPIDEAAVNQDNHRCTYIPAKCVLACACSFWQSRSWKIATEISHTAYLQTPTHQLLLCCACP